MSNPYIEVPDDDELSKEQLEVYSHNLDSNLLINGSAGSGKTILAILRAKKLEEKGKRVLFIVFTNVLKAFTQLAMKEFQLKNVKLAKLSDLAKETIGYPKFDLSDDDRNKLCMKYNYDHVIIDEGQDFTMKDFKMFSYFGKVHTICCDRKQGIYETDFDIKQLINFYPNIAEKILLFTYRNPENILKLSLDYFYKKYNIIPSEQKGIKVYAKTKGNCTVVHTNNEIDSIAQLIQNRGNSSIGILLPRSQSVKYISEALEARGVEIQKRYVIRRPGKRVKIVDNINFDKTITKVVTFWSCKGIQFDTVIIPFMDEESSPEYTSYSNESKEGKAFYVAMTRPKEKLYFIKPSEYSFPYEDYLDPNLYKEMQIDQTNIKPDDVYKF